MTPNKPLLTRSRRFRTPGKTSHLSKDYQKTYKTLVNSHLFQYKASVDAATVREIFAKALLAVFALAFCAALIIAISLARVYLRKDLLSAQDRPIASETGGQSHDGTDSGSDVEMSQLGTSTTAQR
jgi:hypothetical protein